MGYSSTREEYYSDEELSPDYFPKSGKTKFQKGDLVTVKSDKYKRYKYLVGRTGTVVAYYQAAFHYYVVEFKGIGRKKVLGQDLVKF